MRTRRAIALLAAGFVALVVLRETGVIGIHLSTMNCASTRNSEWTSPEGTPPNAAADVRVVFAEDPAYETPARVVQAGKARPPEIIVHVDPYEVAGWTWLPLYKSGTCSYTARAYLDDDPWGSIDGSMELTVAGISSRREFHEGMRATIRTELTQTVRSWAQR